MMYGRIYKITCLLNGKIYIGLTTKSIQERFLDHYHRTAKERSAIQNSMRFHGKENFTIELLEECQTREELETAEVKWIKQFQSNMKEFGYNLTEGGGGITNMSQEIRDKISKTKTGKKVPSRQGHNVSLETRLKISKSLGAKKVRGVHKIFGYVVEYNYPTEAKKDGFNPSLICAVINGKRPHHKNYIFSYIDDANPDLITENKQSVAVQRIVSDPVEKQTIN